MKPQIFPATEPRRALEGAWVPVAASVSGKPLVLRELQVKYLVFDETGSYNIIDRGNRVIDSGEYLVNHLVMPHTLDIVGRRGPNAGRTMHARYELAGNRLTVGYELQGQENTIFMLLDEPLWLSITYERARTSLS